MLTNISWSHQLVLLAFLALGVVALFQVWRDAKRRLLAKIIWTVAIVLVPLIGVIAWLVNWSIGKLTTRLNRHAV